MPTELTNEQRRQLIDVQQAYAACTINFFVHRPAHNQSP